MCSDPVVNVEQQQLVAIVGPTAVGKSALAVETAIALGAAEVINADSMQLYRGLDIGTGKLTESEQRGVPHYLLDIWNLDYRASVQEFQERARAQIATTNAAGKTALLVGGSGLYINAVIDDLQFPGTDPDIRAKWEEELALQGSQALHKELAERDPEAAANILPGNGRRIVRALEVVELTGQPFIASLGSTKRLLEATVIGLDVDRDVLDERINARVEQMWQQGWVAETAELCAQGLAQAPTASRALGYQQILRHLQGELTQEQAMEETKTATRRFARKQLSWFRRDEQTQWFDAASPSLSADVIELIERTHSDGDAYA